MQATPAQVQILVGTEHLRCLRLTKSGLTRWFTDCCRTPLANTSRHTWMPFVGLMVAALDTEDETLLGPSVHANGTSPTPWKSVLRSCWALLVAFLLRRHRPNAFFDERGEPVAQPKVVS